MNPLYIHPIILPMSSGGSGGLDSRMLVSIFIVINVLWMLAFIAAVIHTSIINRNSLYKESLRDRDYFYILSGIFGITDAVLIIISLIHWVSTLL